MKEEKKLIHFFEISQTTWLVGMYTYTYSTALTVGLAASQPTPSQFHTCNVVRTYHIHTLLEWHTYEHL